MATERLYFGDSYLREFDARVAARGMLGERPALALDRSAFYPEGGGQLADRGTLDGYAVCDVQAREGLVWHAFDSDPPLALGDRVVGAIDWPRRFRLMQVHHGQHLLSAALAELLAATTLAVHMGLEGGTLDVDRPALSADEAAAVEARVNAVIWEVRPVEARFVSHEELRALPLRKPPTVAGDIRVVIVPGFDYSACGGTHPRSTAEVGALALRGWERYKGGLRILFRCGNALLDDARRQNALLRALASGLSVAEDELPQAVDRLRAEAVASRKALALAHEQLAGHEGRALYQAAPAAQDGLRVVCLRLDGRGVDELRALARAIAALPGGVALLGAAGEKALLVFARAEDAPGDMGLLLRAAAQAVGGKGGGQPMLAQGGGPDTGALDAALAQAHASYLRRGP
jgi:alanyl-tRNA synthetase